MQFSPLQASVWLRLGLRNLTGSHSQVCQYANIEAKGPWGRLTPQRTSRAEESQQDHAQGDPQDASDDARPILDGVGHSADQSVEPRSGQQKQTQTHAEKVRQEGRGHKRGPPFVWDHVGAEEQRSGNENGTGQSDLLGPTGTAPTNTNMLDKTYKADIKRITLNIMSPNRGRAQARTGLHPQPWNESYRLEDLLKTRRSR